MPGSGKLDRFLAACRDHPLLCTATACIIPQCLPAFGAAAGSGGIGYDMFMAGSFYLNLREMGFLTYVVLAAVILLEMAATRVKSLTK